MKRKNKKPNRGLLPKHTQSVILLGESLDTPFTRINSSTIRNICPTLVTNNDIDLPDELFDKYLKENVEEFSELYRLLAN